MSQNAPVYAAHGIRCDGEEKLKKVIDHFLGSAHTAATERKELEQKWNKGSSSHPWIKTIEKVNTRNLECLINMFYEIYNDSRVLTLSANSYPSRALTHMAAKSLIAAVHENGIDTEFQDFNPTSAELHY